MFQLINCCMLALNVRRYPTWFQVSGNTRKQFAEEDFLAEVEKVDVQALQLLQIGNETRRSPT